MIFGRHKKHLTESKKQGTVNFNVIPMIDMLLVCNIFLFMNSVIASFAIFQSPDLVLPKSYSADELGYNTEIAVTAMAIYMEGVLVEPAFKEYEDKDIPELPGLSESLKKHKEEMIAKGENPEPAMDGSSAPGGGFRVTIRADKRLPFKMLQKVMYTCNINGFDRMEFAVIKNEMIGNVEGEVGG